MTIKTGDKDGVRSLPPPKNVNTSIQLAPGDLELLDVIQKRLGVKRSEAIRTAIRVYAAILKK